MKRIRLVGSAVLLLLLLVWVPVLAQAAPPAAWMGRSTAGSLAQANPGGDDTPPGDPGAGGADSAPPSMAGGGAADRPTASVTVYGLMVTVGAAQEQDIPDTPMAQTMVGDPRLLVYQRVPVAVSNQTEQSLTISDLDFSLVTSDAASWGEFPCDGGWGIGHTGPSVAGTPALQAGQTLTGTLCFTVGRNQTPAALYWAPPFRIAGIATPLPPGDSTALQLIRLPVLSGQQPIPLSPDGPRGSYAQQGVSLKIGAMVQDPSPTFRYGPARPPGTKVLVMPLEADNDSPISIDGGPANFFALDASGMQFPASDADSHVARLLTQGTLQPGQHLQVTVAFEVPGTFNPVAIRWSPSGYWGMYVPHAQVILLP